MARDGTSADRPPLRRDAERNRQRILEAAGRLISERGLDISHDEIAREANVGVGTVYRRFPTREQLFDALYHDQLDAMVAVADEAAQLDDPWRALEFFLVRTFEDQATNRGLRELLIGHGGSTELARSAQARVGPVVEDIVARAKQAGSMNPAIAATDVAMVPVMINAIMRASHDADPQLWRRWTAIIMEGMATGRRAREFPSSAPRPDDIPRIIGGGTTRHADGPEEGRVRRAGQVVGETGEDRSSRRSVAARSSSSVRKRSGPSSRSTAKPWVAAQTDTTATARWRAHATLADGGEPYRNLGVHIVRLRWLKIVDMDVYQDTQILRDALDRQAAAGMHEAAAAPITSTP